MLKWQLTDGKTAKVFEANFGLVPVSAPRRKEQEKKKEKKLAVLHRFGSFFARELTTHTDRRDELFFFSLFRRVCSLRGGGVQGPYAPTKSF